MASTVSSPTVANQEQSIWRQALVPIAGIAALRVLLYLVIAPNYGYFRDELYYIACGQHPAWGYVDQPPLIAWITWILQHSIGTSLYALRLTPMLADVATIFLTARLAYEFGARKFGIALAAFAVLTVPIFLIMTHIYTMNAFDLPLWTACILLVVRVAKTGNMRLWIPFGFLAGLTVLNKYGIVFFLVALLAGMALTPWRKMLLNSWFWAGAAITAAISLPNFLWQLNRGFPFLVLMRNIRARGRDIALPPLEFLGQQFQIIGLLAVVLAVAALAFFFTSRGKQFRALGWSFLFFTALMMVMKAKNYYLGPVYPMVIAAGSVQFECWTETDRWRWIRPATVALTLILSLVALPFIVPVLPVPAYIKYQKTLHFGPPKFENQLQGPLPQIYADMYGWEEKAEQVARYYNSLPPEERVRTPIFAQNYGDAGAIDFFGARYGLPKSISGHQNYFFWGPREYTGESIIFVGRDNHEGWLERECTSFVEFGRNNHPLARPDENKPMFHCRGFKYNLKRDWDKARNWN